MTKISEAEVAIREGIKDILVTSPQVGAKIPRLIECAKKTPNVYY